MCVIDSKAVFKKLGENRARMERLGITESEIARYYVDCGAEGERRNEAFAQLKRRFGLGEEDAAFVADILGGCGPF
jgi:hypothetical protein